MLSILRDAFPGAIQRFQKRHAGEDVTPADYKVLWAETTESGIGKIAHVSEDKNAELPKFRLVSRKNENGEQWHVAKEKLIFDIHMPNPLISSTSFSPLGNGDFRYEVIKDLGDMNTDEMVTMLRAADETTGRSMGHISGVTKPRYDVHDYTEPAPK